MRTATSIAHVTSCYPPHLGGVEVVVQALAHEQSRMGAEVVVMTTSAGAPHSPAHAREGRVSVRRYRARTVAHTPLAPGLFVALLRLPPTVIRHVHVAHAFTTEWVWLTSRMRRARFVAHFHLDVAPSGPLGWLLKPYKRLLLAPALRAADRVIALNQAMADFLAESYHVDPARITIIRNGVSREFSGVAEQRSPSSVAGRPLRLLFAGRIAPQKNLPRLLEALALVTVPTELTVVGEGEGRRAAQELVRELNLDNVSFVGAKYDSAYRTYLQHADLFVLPSDQEGMPLAVLEAMAAGLPVLATRVPGTTELVDGVGLLVEPTARGLAAGITSLAGDDAALRQLARRGLRKAADHTWPAIAAELAPNYPTAMEPR